MALENVGANYSRSAGLQQLADKLANQTQSQHGDGGILAHLLLDIVLMEDPDVQGRYRDDRQIRTGRSTEDGAGDLLGYNGGRYYFVGLNNVPTLVVTRGSECDG